MIRSWPRSSRVDASASTAAALLPALISLVLVALVVFQSVEAGGLLWPVAELLWWGDLTWSSAGDLAGMAVIALFKTAVPCLLIDAMLVVAWKQWRVRRARR